MGTADRSPRPEAKVRKPSVLGRHATRPPAPAGAGSSIVDLHTHTTRSDGLLAPAELVREVAAAGVRVLAVTDHDTLGGYREVVAAGAVPRGFELIAGVEINAIARGIPLADGELHILGYGLDADDEAFEAILAGQRAARRVRFERTVERLRAIGMPIDAQVAGVDLSRDDALGRPTIARALIAAGFIDNVEDAFQRLIGWGGPAYVPREGLGPADAIAAVRAAGGLAALAHFSEAPDQIPLLRELVALGLRGLEVYYRSFSTEVVAAVAAVADELALVPTGGSDYHGDLMSYADTHAELHIPPTVVERLHEALES